MDCQVSKGGIQNLLDVWPKFNIIKRSYNIFRKIQMVTLKIHFKRFGFFDNVDFAQNSM